MCFFGISAFFSIAIFVVVLQNLEESLLERTNDRLNSINLFKVKLVKQLLSSQRTEIFRILEYQRSHQSSEQDLIDALSSILDVQQIGLVGCTDCDGYFSAATLPDSSLYRFEYGLDTTFIRVYLDYQSLKGILKERTGLGATGESYLVGPNFRMMSESIFYPDSLPQLIPCKTVGAVKAFQYLSGVEAYPDYRGVPIIGAYRLVDFFGIKMALLTEIDVEEAMSPIVLIRENMILLLLILLILSLVGSSFLADLLQRPVIRLHAIADKLTRGELPESNQDSEFIEEYSEITQSMNKLVEALRSTVHFANNIGKGKMHEEYVSLGDKDELGKAIMTMRDQLVILDRQKTSLERQSKRILIEEQEKERERIARDLHDGLGAMLTTMNLRLSNELNQATKEELKHLLSEAIKEARNLSRNLMPTVLMDFGLFDALAQLAQSTEKNTGVKVIYTCDSEHGNSRLKKSKQVYVYRIVQEVLTNAVKHADCSEIRCTITEFDDQMNIYIKDNGKGIEDNAISESTGLGFRNIKERTALLNGELILESDENGTVVEINFPLK